MTKYEVGDLVVLTAGSMRMAVEAVEITGDAADPSTATGTIVSTIWCHEGQIGRDRFDARLLKKWEVREDHGAGSSGRPPRGDGGLRAHGGARGRDGRSHDGRSSDGRAHDRGGRDGAAGGGGGGEDRPRQKTGWDGKPREKKFFRKD